MNIHQLKLPLTMESFQINLIDENIQHFFVELMENNDFQNAITLRDQIGIACEYLRTKSNNISFNQIALFFQKNKAIIWKQYQKWKKGKRGNPGRPSILNDEQYQFIVQYVQYQFSEKKPVTYDQLLDIVEYKYGITLKIDTLRHIIYTIDNIKVVTGVPM